MTVPSVAVGDQVKGLNPIFVKVIFCLYPFLLPLNALAFILGKERFEEGQWMVMESCVNGMRNVWKVYTKGSAAQVRVGAGRSDTLTVGEKMKVILFFKLVLLCFS